MHNKKTFNIEVLQTSTIAMIAQDLKLVELVSGGWESVVVERERFILGHLLLNQFRPGSHVR